MYKIIPRRPDGVQRLAGLRQQLHSFITTTGCSPLRGASTTTTTTTTTTNPPPTSQPLVNFDQLIRARRSEAARSILVQVNSERSHPELHRYCRQFGAIRGAQHYQHDDMHYILLEFETAAGADAAVASGAHNEACTGTVVQSPFLWFRAGPKAKLTTTQQQSELPDAAPADLLVVDGTAPTANAAVYAALRRAPTVDAQMLALHACTRLNDCGTRLRFLAARQIEQSLHGLFPHAQALPFGSSVNGFGRTGCDLDLILRLRPTAEGNAAEAAARPESRLVYHSKEQLSNGRSQQQREMEAIGDMLQLFLPGVCHVRRILQARVPIIKYQQDHLNLEVDLSMSNLTGVYMSELLYMCGQLDERVQPLIFTVRHWAQAVGLTNASPGRWISNFSLTCLVVFYLQQLAQPILPAIGELTRHARRPADVRITEDGINCTFLRDLRAVHELRTAPRNQSTLAELLLGFFEFCAQVNFADRALSLNEGRLVSKPDHSPVYIVNPLEAQLNVSKNISAEECERLRIEVRNAAWSLDSFGEPQQADADWGVLSIARASTTLAGTGKTIIRPNMFYKPRMVDVSDLFASDGDDGDRQQSTSAAPPPPTTFKNAAVRGMVEKIQRQGRETVQKMRSEFERQNATQTAAKAPLPTQARRKS